MKSPDRWVIVQFDNCVKKVFATWYGGLTGSSCWNLNSGVKSIEKKDKFYYITGYSGSVYKCHEEAYGLSVYGAGILYGWQKEIEIEILDFEKII